MNERSITAKTLASLCIQGSDQKVRMQIFQLVGLVIISDHLSAIAPLYIPQCSLQDITWWSPIRGWQESVIDIGV